MARGPELTLIVAAADSEELSANVACEVVDEAREATDELVQLATAASRICELINTIVGQTNLLALRVTIEALRASEAHRGFAALARRALAEQATKAIGEISQQITGIQHVTNLSVDAVKAISGAVERMSESCSVIAYAAEEQGGAAREIYHNICAYQNLVQEIRWQAGCLLSSLD